MPEPRDICRQDCERLLRTSAVGRVALSTPEGPHIVPVNYAVIDETIVVRTSAYSVLGTYGHNAMLAFEVDQVDHERHAGWSVVARGRGWAELDPDQVAAIRRGWQPRPWASGNRNLYLRMRWECISGRALGVDWTRHDESRGHHTLFAL